MTQYKNCLSNQILSTVEYPRNVNYHQNKHFNCRQRLKQINFSQKKSFISHRHKISNNTKIVQNIFTIVISDHTQLAFVTSARDMIYKRDECMWLNTNVTSARGLPTQM